MVPHRVLGRHHDYTGGNLCDLMTIHFMLFCPLPSKSPCASPSREPSGDQSSEPRMSLEQIDAFLDACPTQRM